MKKNSFKKLLFSLKVYACLSMAPQVCFAQTAMLNAGTVISIRTDNKISSKGSDNPSAVVSSNVKDGDGNVLIEANTPVMLNVVRQKAKSWGKPGVLMVNGISTTSSDGQNISLTGTYTVEGDDNKTTACVASAALFLFIFMIGGLTGFFIKGDEAEIPANYIFTNFRVSEATSIKVKK